MAGSQEFTVRRRFSFESAHQLPGHPSCGNIHGHSYNGEIEIVAGALDQAGFVIDFGVLKAITAPYDHGEVLTRTAEQLAEDIGRAALDQLRGQSNAGSIVRVRVVVWETPKSCAEWVWHVQGQ